MRSPAVFCRDEEGQDIIEYTLLMAFIVLASMALLVSGRPGIEGIWSANTNRLAEASSAIGGS
jgi:Flp pilus assembly pilin Flp